MFDENGKHCNECVCMECELRGTDSCIEGNDLCDRCENDEHTISCVFFEEEE